MTYRPYFQIIAAVDPATVKSTLQNNSGLTVLKHTPVKLNTNGELSLIDVSIDDDILNLVGISNEMILTGNAGEVVTQGKVKNITSFSFGDYIYVSKTGGLTNVLPSEGVSGFVSGDWVVKVGTIGKNQDDPLLKDLFINIQIIGQL
jgi:hypothetical protein